MKAKFTHFGMYPRLFVKSKETLFPIIEKYHGSSVADLNKGQVIKIYFNLLRSDASFRAEVDALISVKGDKLYTVQQKVMAKVGAVRMGNSRGGKVSNSANFPDPFALLPEQSFLKSKLTSNFIEDDSNTIEDVFSNDDYVSNPSLSRTMSVAWDEATFAEAIGYEENQETVSMGMIIAGLMLVGLTLWYGYKYVKKHKIVK